MEWNYEQKFNGLNNGDLNGQDGWVSGGSTVLNVGNYTPNEGSKNLKASILNNGDFAYTRTLPGYVTGTFYFSAKVDTLEDFGISLTAYMGVGAANLIISFQSTGIYAYDNTGAADVKIGDVLTDTWYTIGVEFDISLNRYRAKVDSGNWSAWFGLAVAEGDVIDTLEIDGSNASGSTINVYLDTITYDSTQSVSAVSFGIGPII